MCSPFVVEKLNEMEAGGLPTPLFFSGPDCSGLSWPTSTPLTEADLGNRITQTQMCPDSSRLNCPVPYISSMILPPGLRLTFRANDQGDAIDHATGSLITVPTAEIKKRIQELGQLNLTAAAANNNLLTNLAQGTNGLTWYSAVTAYPGEPGPDGTQDSANPQICDNMNLGASYNDDGQMQQSFISCGSPFYPSFLDVDNYFYTQQYQETDTTKNWTIARINKGGSGAEEDNSDYNAICRPGGIRRSAGAPSGTGNPGAALEKQVMDSVRSNPTNGENCGTSGSTFQAAGCLATKAEAQASADPQQIEVDGSCYPNACGACFGGKVAGEDDKLFCLCNSLLKNGVYSNPTVRGSIKDFTVTLINKDQQEVDFIDLQAEWCVNPPSLGGIQLQRYGQGQPVCDEIMTEVCFNTAKLANNPSLARSCQCLLEQKRLQAQFVGIDLPVQCFSTVCSTDNPEVYKTSQQISGCNARLCQQTLSVHGSAILLQGFQELICNGEIYDLENLPDVGDDVPLVTPGDISDTSFDFGTLFYVSIGLLVLMLVLVVIWGIRRGRATARAKAREKKTLESLLRSKIGTS